MFGKSVSLSFLCWGESVISLCFVKSSLCLLVRFHCQENGWISQPLLKKKGFLCSIKKIVKGFSSVSPENCLQVLLAVNPEASRTFWNRLEPPGTAWNRLEPPGTAWNHLEPPRRPEGTGVHSAGDLSKASGSGTGGKYISGLPFPKNVLLCTVSFLASAFRVSLSWGKSGWSQIFLFSFPDRQKIKKKKRWGKEREIYFSQTKDKKKKIMRKRKRKSILIM